MLTNKQVVLKINDLLKIYRMARFSKGYSLGQTAIKSGITMLNICNIESGKYFPKLESFVRLCDAVGLDIQLIPKGETYEST